MIGRRRGRFSMQPQFSYFLAEAWGSTRHRGARKAAAAGSYRPRVEQLEGRTLMAGVAWGGHARDPQHTATSPVASQPLDESAWQPLVDLAPQHTPGSNYLLIHYGSPLVTEANTVIVPVKTGASGGFRVEGRNATNGALKWTQTTDYVLPPHGWVPSYAPTLTPANRL